MTSTNRLLAFLLVVVASASALWFLDLKPKKEEAAALQEQLVAKESERDQQLALVASYEQARSAYASNYTRVARLGKAVPAEDDTRSMMVQVDHAAKKSKVNFKSIDVAGGPVGAVVPIEGANTAGFTPMSYKLAFEGRYFPMSAFFTRLERFVEVSNKGIDVKGRLLVIDSFKLTPKDKESSLMKAEVTATSYLVPESEGVTNGATPTTPVAGAPAPGPQESPGSPTVTGTASVPGVQR